MQVSFSLKPKDVVSFGWLCGWGMLLSLAVGSHMEAEPRAAFMFGVLAGVWTLAVYPLLKWRNK